MANEAVSEKLSDYATRLKEAVVGREHAQTAQNFLQALTAQEGRVDTLSAVLPEDVLPLPVLTDEQKSALTSIAGAGKQSDELKALRDEVVAILSVDESILPLGEETRELAKSLVDEHVRVFAAQESTRSRGRRRSGSGENAAEDFDPSRRLGGHMRVTFADGFGNPRNSYIGDWGSIRYDWQVRVDWKMADSVMNGILPELQKAQALGETFHGVFADTDGNEHVLDYNPVGEIA